MRISIIAAMDRNQVIGRNNELPWHLPADLKWFKECTMGKPVLMGRNTYESLGKPLPGRLNLVLTRELGYLAAGCVVVNGVKQAIDAAENAEELMVIGGQQIFEQTISRADRLYLTIIDAEFEGDALFPPYDRSEWDEVWHDSFAGDEKNPYSLEFKILDRIKK